MVGQEKQLQHRCRHRLVVLSVSSCGDGSEHYITTCNHCQCSCCLCSVLVELPNSRSPTAQSFPSCWSIAGGCRAYNERNARMSRGYGNNGSHIYPNILVWESTRNFVLLIPAEGRMCRPETVRRYIHHRQMKRIPSGSFEAELHGWMDGRVRGRVGKYKHIRRIKLSTSKSPVRENSLNIDRCILIE